MQQRSAGIEGDVTGAGWVTVAELAARCAVTPGTVYRWISEGTGPRVIRTGRTNRGIRIPVSAVTEWEQQLMGP
ncbi:helix-turn-helix transcriptional regulator (plasmid) [Kitasatospora griseola]|uniref:helix-turn-helix transcriptional regulator n=1 Tax=Kitasatospora griseola TaxID=2064 RepID=UPI0038556A79